MQLTVILLSFFILWVEPSGVLGHQDQHAASNQNNRIKPSTFWNVRHVLDEMFDSFGFGLDEGNEDEMDFHYFTFHDLDSNKLLDGLELMLALGHGDGTKKGNVPTLEEQRTVHQELEKTAEIVDEILKEDDFNNDGFLDYTEFRKSIQRPDSKF